MSDHITDNFRWAEARCKCGQCIMPESVLLNVEILADHLEVVRLAFGKPIQITSWYRCPARNAKVGGAKKSIHLTGLAVDIKCAGMNGPQIASRLEKLIADERIADGGIGVYAHAPGMAHYDVRTAAGMKRARWSHGDSDD